MPETADLIIHSAAQLVACASPDGPKRGAAMRDLGAMADGALAIRNGRILAVGSTPDIRARYAAPQAIDASGRAVCPGLVDAHTHAVYAGDRIGEFEMRIQGATYLEIMEAGGGIVSTMHATRAASIDQLVREAAARLDEMLRLGTTTVEIKTGYGLSVEAEMALLHAIAQLAETHPATLVPTFLGAHAIPPEYQGREDEYVTLVVDRMLPQAAAWHRASPFPARGVPLFVDVFCERGAFSLAQSRRVLEAGRALGLGLKIHADEFTALGGVGLAVELGATSVDHLDATTPADMARLAASDTVGVVLPAVNFHLGSHHYADARGLIDAGAAIALATDINPGSAPCLSMPLVMAIACRYQRLLPAEALHAATINAAYAVGLGDRIGSLEAGKEADILILSAPDARYLAYQLGGNVVECVIKKGVVVWSRSEL